MHKLHAKVCHVILGTWTALDFGIHWGLGSNPAVIQSNGCMIVLFICHVQYHINDLMNE